MDVKPLRHRLVPASYKQTDVGIIPEEWEVAALGDKTEKVGSGVTPTGGERVYKQEGRPFMRSQNVGWGTLLLDDVAFIDDATHSTFPDTEIKVDDVFLNITGASIGRSAVADVRVRGGNVNQHVCIIRANQLKLVPRYLNYFLLSTTGQRQIDSFQAGGNRQGLNFGQVRSFRLPLPKPPEQRAIAGALTDVDALIGALDRLIAKKRDLKQAAMQQLLTGQTRLPGFAPANSRISQTEMGSYPCDWILKSLGQLIDDSRTIRYGIVQPGKYDARGRLMIRGQDYSKGWVTPAEMFRVSDQIEERYKNARVKSGDLIITIVGAGTGTVEAIPDWLDGANLTQTTARVAINKREADSDYCKYILQTKVGTRQVANFIKGGAQPGLNCGDITKFIIPMPPTVAEQTAIAGVLTDMDAELAALQQRREKTRALKEAMIQELLTGRTRLI